MLTWICPHPITYNTGQLRSSRPLSTPQFLRQPSRTVNKSMADSEVVLQLNQKLLNAIGTNDYEQYEKLCDPSLTCFEPEARGHQVKGLDFHKYYFTMPSSHGPDAPKPHLLNTIASPHVRFVGDKCAVVTYTRLTQKMEGGAPVTVAAEETRVWEKKDDGSWVHVHMHRSLVK